MDTSDSSQLPSAESETVLFRPSKKRKIYRQRAGDVDEDMPSAIASSSTVIVPPHEPDLAEADPGESTRISMAEILRLRKQRKTRVGGVEFRSTPALYAESPSDALVPANAGEGNSEVPEPVARFAKQTGLAGNVDKHM